VETIETETVPLVKAVASNDLMAVTVLLDEGADANVKNSVEMPVLVMAIRRGSAPIVEALLKHGADPNVRMVDTDLTPLLQCRPAAGSRINPVFNRRGICSDQSEPSNDRPLRNQLQADRGRPTL